MSRFKVNSVSVSERPQEASPEIGKTVEVFQWSENFLGTWEHKKVFRQADDKKPINMPYGTRLHFFHGICVKTRVADIDVKQHGVCWPEGVTMTLFRDEGDDGYLHPDNGDRGIALKYVPRNTQATIVSVPKN